MRSSPPASEREGALEIPGGEVNEADAGIECTNHGGGAHGDAEHGGKAGASGAEVGPDGGAAQSPLVQDVEERVRGAASKHGVATVPAQAGDVVAIRLLPGGRAVGREGVAK